MATFQINDDEQYALKGASLLAFRVYFVLRRRMDFKTGITGKDYSVSMQSMIDEISTPPKQGTKGYTPSKSELRVALDYLEKVELISRDSDKNRATRQAIYKLNLADFDDKNSSIAVAYSQDQNHSTKKEPNSSIGISQPQPPIINGSNDIQEQNYSSEKNQNSSIAVAQQDDEKYRNSPLSVYKTTTTTREDNFQMFLEWLPDLKILSRYLLHYGLGIAEKVPIGTIKKFTGHWSTRPDLFKSEAKWCEQLARWHKSNVEREKANASTNTGAGNQGQAKHSGIDLQQIATEDF